jgi:ketosteroid isomerase-like protein
MSQDNVQLLRAWIEAFNRRDRAAIARLNHPAIEWRTSVEDPDATTHLGQEAVRGYLDGYIESFPDLHIEATECFAVGDAPARAEAPGPADDRVVQVARERVSVRATGRVLWVLRVAGDVPPHGRLRTAGRLPLYRQRLRR